MSSTRVSQAAVTARAVLELVRSGVLRPVRPDRLVGMLTALWRYGLSVTAGCAAGAARHPDRPAIVDDTGVLTYAELHARTDSLARVLADSGVGPGVRVGLLCRNHRGPVEVQIATGKIGADVVLLNSGLSAGQLGEVAGRLRLHTLVVDPEFTPVLTELPTDCVVITTGYEDLVVRDAPGPLPRRPAVGHTIVLTSGTTGPPKGARRPPVHGLTPIAAVLATIPLRAARPVHIAAPLLHSWGHAALQLSVLHGAPIVLAGRFDAAGLLDLVERYHCDTVFGVPVMLARVLQQPERDGHKPRIVAVSGSALPAGLATAFLRRFGPVLYNLYGSTEASWVSIATPADLQADPATAGRAPVGTRLLVLDDDGAAVPAGTEGRVFVGNDMAFDGYTDDGADVERRGDLLGTGDIGVLDPSGRLRLTGRADDMIVSGGENVHPGPVEELIAARAEVREAAVVGVADAEFGQRFAAYVVPEPGADLDADTVRDWVRAELSRYAVPRDVIFLDELPRNATGKVVPRELTG